MADRIQTLFGRRMRQLRVERGLSQAVLAEQADVTPEYISRIERGVVGPSMDVIGRLARCLHVEPKELFEFGPVPTRADPVVGRITYLAAHGNASERQLLLRIAETVVHWRRARRG